MSVAIDQLLGQTDTVLEHGRLRIHLGAAAGVGTTYALLEEAIRRCERGTRLAVGCVDPGGRRRTADLLRRLTDDLGVSIRRTRRLSTSTD